MACTKLEKRVEKLEENLESVANTLEKLHSLLTKILMNEVRIKQIELND